MKGGALSYRDNNGLQLEVSGHVKPHSISSARPSPHNQNTAFFSSVLIANLVDLLPIKYASDWNSEVPSNGTEYSNLIQP